MRYRYLPRIMNRLPDDVRRGIALELRRVTVATVRRAVKRGRISGAIQYSYDGKVYASIPVKDKNGVVEMVKSKGWPDLNVTYVVDGVGQIHLFEMQLLKLLSDLGIHFRVSGVCLSCLITSGDGNGCF